MVKDYEAMGAEHRARFVTKAVERFTCGERMKNAVKCRAYYETQNPDIESRKKTYAGVMDDAADTMRAVAVENKFASNIKVKSSFFRDITDSKVQYLAGEGADVTAVNEADIEAVKSVFDPMRDNMRRIEQECLTDALTYGRGYAYMTVKNGTPWLEYTDYCEVIPFYDRYNLLESVIRYYKRDKVEYAEIHTPAMVYEFERRENSGGGNFTETGERPQIVVKLTYPTGEAEQIGSKDWRMLPWFEMRQNKDGKTSLTPSAESMIECYDITNSDFANNLVDFADVFMKLGDTYSSGMDYGETIKMVKQFKVFEGNGDVQTVDIPYQARKELLQILKSGIYSALRGVDVSNIALGTTNTATAIRALYSDVDNWADGAEWYLKDWVLAVLTCAADYMGEQLPPVNIRFTRRMIFDETAQMDAIARQKGIISDLTLLENHPLVTDAQAELERLELDNSGLPPVYGNGAGVEGE